ncbi:MAG: hypothetical protein ACREB9_01370 [Thermoplasmata archaeon]
MRVVILVLGLPPGTPQPTANRFTQKFYGQDTTTRGGNYRYRKAGLLDSVPHRRLRRGVVILRERDLTRVTRFLDEWKARYEVRVIRPTSDDLSDLTQARS